MRHIYLFALICAFNLGAIAQISAPGGVQTNAQPNWGPVLKVASDSCGAYFNNYVGLAKTSNVRIESMRTGNAIESGEYNGRAEKFKAPQPIEVGGLEFYAYIKDNPTMDSIMVIAALNEYNAGTNTLGTELARDTIYVAHHTYNPTTTPLPNISVKSYFDNPVTVTSDYVISIQTPTDDSLKIIANDPNVNDGNGEGMGYALYDNVNFPTFYGWYDMIIDFSADYDFLISPMVRFKLHDGFPSEDSTACPGEIEDFCIDYPQMPVFIENQYHSDASNSLSYINIDWGDTQSNDDEDTICHTYNISGDFDVVVKDTFYRWENSNPTCEVELMRTINVPDSIELDFTADPTNLSVDFTSTLTGVDSVSWDFGDGSPATDDENPTHIYQNSGSYNVWLHAYNDCMTKSLFKVVEVGVAGIGESKTNDFNIFPNPANKQIGFSNLNGTVTVNIYNITGEQIYSNRQFKKLDKINIEHLSNGTYFVKIKSDSAVITKKLVVRH